MGMLWSPGDCTRNDFLRDACRTEKLSIACISISEKPVQLSVGGTTQGVPGGRGHRNLRAEDLRPHHPQRMHVLEAIDHQLRLDFSRWFLQRLAVEPDFAAHVLFADECSYSREGIFNAYYLNIH
ncbi:hypothetical protein TNCV_4709481 [Trichonephila clavipes]|nr:hypothetical protein TNCV_4709481 [Trichonephila clavipes]